MMFRLALGAVLAAGLLAASGRLVADDEKPAAKPTHHVKKGPLKIVVKLDGVLEAREMTPISVDAEAWHNLSVLEAVEHGARVEKGQTLVSLDLEDIDTAIEELESSQKLAELSLQVSRAELKAAESGLPVDLAAAERAKRLADEDLKLFLEKTRPLLEKNAEFMLKSAMQYVEYQEEELKQLVKMYEADDLTEETEEIIVKRARNDVEQARFYLETTRAQNQETLEVSLPRQETTLKEAATRHEIDLEKVKTSLAVSPDRLKLSLERSLVDQRQSADKLKKLKHDRDAMAVKAPVAGIVYYGHCEHGKWSDLSGGKLKRGSSLQSRAVFMTIVQPRPVFVRATVAEKELHRLRSEISGTAGSVAYPKLVLPAKLESVATVPTADGHFDVRVAVETSDDDTALLPGMTCHVTLVAYNKADAVTVPASAVFSDDDDRTHFVYRVGADGTHQKAEVTLCERTDDKVEIVQGLLEGDTILTERP